jgi:diamine N-acetyltransferase
MHQAYCRIVPLDRYNWEACLDIRLLPEQESFVPSVLFSLAQARFENLSPFGIQVEGEMVGMIMYGDFGGICWISRILIHYEHQGKGVGKAAMRQLLEHLTGKASCKEIRTSYAAHNEAAANFFTLIGFRPISEPVDGEIVARYEGVDVRLM